MRAEKYASMFALAAKMAIIEWLTDRIEAEAADLNDPEFSDAMHHHTRAIKALTEKYQSKQWKTKAARAMPLHSPVTQCTDG